MTVLLTTLVLALLLAALAVLYVALPLFRPTRTVLIDESGPLAELILRKDTLLQSIKELEFDYQTGKLSEEDYQRMDQRQRQQAIVLLRQIEQTLPAAAGLEAELEAAIRRQRTASDRASVTEAEAMSCPRCQSTVRPADKFCPECGFALRPALVQQS
jgi:Tfp pilus assembly protein PilN